MKNFKLKRLLGLAFIGCLSALNASTVFAAAGDTISNTASLDYNVGGVAQTTATGTVAFVEDNLVNFTVAWVDGANVPVAAGATGQMLTFEVTNNGNGAQDFALTAINALIADGFDVTPASISVVVDDPAGASPGVYDAGDTATFIDELAPLGVIQVYVFADIPTPLAAALLANVTLTAEVRAGDPAGATGALGAVLSDDSAAADNATEQNVLNDAAGIAPDVAKDGLHSVNGIYEVVAANLSVAKVVNTLWDPVNGNVNPKAIPGAIVQYTITITNAAGGASATLTTLSDALQAVAAGSLSFDTVLVVNDGVTAESALGNIRIDTTAGGLGAGTGRLPAALEYCVAEAADANTDGCSYTVGTRTLDLTFSDVIVANPNIAAMAAEAGYTEGELKAGESIDIVFNAYVD